MLKRSIVLILTVFASGCGALGVSLTDKNVTTCVLAKNVIKDKDNVAGPSGITDTYSLEDKVCIYTSFSWDDIDKEGGAQSFEYKWYTGNKLVAKRSSDGNFKNPPQHTWHCFIASSFGLGSHSVEMYANKKLIASKHFTVQDKAKEPSK